MKLHVILALVAITLMLASCSIMDLSSQETAETLAPKTVEVSLYEGLGADLSSLVIDNQSEESDIIRWFVTGLKAGVSLSPKLDLVGRVYTSGFTAGGKLGVKVLSLQNESTLMSVIPAFNWTRGRFDDEAELDRFNSLGLEATLLASWFPDKAISPTLGARVNYDYYKVYDYMSEDSEYRPLVHVGVFFNLRMSIGKVRLKPEAGMELIPGRSTGAAFLPTGSLGLGLEL